MLWVMKDSLEDKLVKNILAGVHNYSNALIMPSCSDMIELTQFVSLTLLAYCMNQAVDIFL